LAPGFDEVLLVACLSGLHEQGFFPQVLTLSARSTRGAHGLQVQGDVSMETALKRRAPNLLIIPGPAASVSTLLADPRTWQMLEAVARCHGVLGTSRTGYHALAHSGGLPGSIAVPVIVQGAEDPAAFAARLASALAAEPG